jgi:intraflagellar transport protein 122
VAEKCFVRLKDLSFAELTKKYGDEQKKNGKINADVLKAEVLAYQGKYQEAASLYVKAGKLSEAI